MVDLAAGSVWPPPAIGITTGMPRVILTATGRGVGASGKDDAFAEMIRTEIARIAPLAHPEIGVAQDDAVAVTVELERRDQADVGEALERLLQDATVESTLVDESPAADD